MQILLFNEIVASVLFNIIAGLYTLVARIYDILLELVRNDGNAFASLNFNFTQTIYVLAGVFMLFRVTIGMLQMIINPDTVSDKEAGAGKMIKRIVTCIILLIALSPDFIIFNKKDGLLIEVEQAILADDGLINRLMPVSSIKEKHSDNMSSKSKLLVDDVYAANEKLTCYYINVKSHKKNLVGTNWTHSYVINDVYKIEFYNNPDTGPTGKLNCGDGTCKFSYYDRSDQRIHGDSDNGYYSPFPGKITMGTVFNVTSSNFPTTCPKYLKKTSDSTYSAQKSMPKGEIDGCDSEVVTASGPQTCKNIGIMGGYNNYNDFEKAIKGLKMNASGQQASHSVETNNLFIGKNTSTSAFDGGKKYFKGLSEKHSYEAIKFAQTTAKTFQECAEDEESEEKCKNAQEHMFENSEANDNIIELMSDDTLNLGFIASLVAGIGLIVYLLILCIDIIIRRFKLLLLEMLAPIPIISYVNPKDKIFNQWVKMYLSIYVDLFIKLFAIAIAVDLLKLISESFWEQNLLIKFFYIVAILVFAKALPSMISKLFGLDSMGSSFKDIMNMGKSAAGFAAGGALGTAVGFATGKGLGRISGAFKGAALGAGSGSKGNITGGSNQIAAKNARINDAKQNGLGFWQRTVAGVAGTVGYSPKTKMDNQIKDKVDKKELLDNFRKHKDNIENLAESSNFLSDKKRKLELDPDNYTYTYIDANGNQVTKTGKAGYKKERSDFIALNETNRKNSQGNIEYYDGQQWIDSGQSDKYVGANGQVLSIDFEQSAKGKIEQAETEMRTELRVNTALQRELGKTERDVQTFAAYEDVEGIARDKSNQYSDEIIAVQKSTEYGKAKAFDDYSKKS